MTQENTPGAMEREGGELLSASPAADKHKLTKPHGEPHPPERSKLGTNSSRSKGYKRLNRGTKIFPFMGELLRMKLYCIQGCPSVSLTKVYYYQPSWTKKSYDTDGIV